MGKKEEKIMELLVSLFKSEFEREPVELHEQMISHILALDVGSKICQAQLCSSIRGCHEMVS